MESDVWADWPSRPGDVLRLVVAQSMRLALGGVAIGVIVALREE